MAAQLFPRAPLPQIPPNHLITPHMHLNITLRPAVPVIIPVLGQSIPADNIQYLLIVVQLSPIFLSVIYERAERGHGIPISERKRAPVKFFHGNPEKGSVLEPGAEPGTMLHHKIMRRSALHPAAFYSKLPPQNLLAAAAVLHIQRIPPGTLGQRLFLFDTDQNLPFKA